MAFESQDEKFSYAIGLSLASNLLQSGIKSVEMNSMFEAIADVLQGKQPQLTPEDANKVITEFFEEQQGSQGAENEKEGTAFLAENAKVDGVNILESGLQYTVITEGTGEKPKASDQVKCHYHGTLVNGNVFDSSVERGEPAVFPVNGVIAGWVEALQMMNTGSKWRLFVPPHLAYGDQGAGGAIGPKATLIFDVELLEIV